MRQIHGIGLGEVRAVYSGPEGRLWELVMGEQVHIGGFQSSTDLAERAGIGAGMTGIDLCCCSGAGMRFLVRFRGVARMRGVDATQAMVDLGRRRCADEGLADRIDFTLADAAEFVWGEDAWCYVVDKPRLIAEAVRLVRPGGVIAFTDWVEGPAAMTDAEAERFLRFMKFPNIESIAGYRGLLEKNGCTVTLADDTGRFAAHVDLYVNMLHMQLTYDALKIIGFDTARMQAMAAEMEFVRGLARAGKVVQGRFVARR